MNKKWWIPLTAGSLSLFGGCSPEPPSADALENALRTLAKQPSLPPTQGAMCYSVTILEEVTYVCPVCHHKTKYKQHPYLDKTDESDEATKSRYEANSWRQSEKIHNLADLTNYRRMVRDISVLLKPSNYSAALDEKSFCSHCDPQGEGIFYLVIKRPEGTQIRNELNSFDDLIILETFLKGYRAWGMNDENDLKKDIPKIRKFLGLPQQ